MIKIQFFKQKFVVGGTAISKGCGLKSSCNTVADTLGEATSFLERNLQLGKFKLHCWNFNCK